jgi:hypothetical protein
LEQTYLRLFISYTGSIVNPLMFQPAISGLAIQLVVIGSNMGEVLKGKVKLSVSSTGCGSVCVCLCVNPNPTALHNLHYSDYSSSPDADAQDYGG